MKLKDKLMHTDIDMVKADVCNFLIDKDELDFWSNDYFLQLADMMKTEGFISNITVYPNKMGTRHFINCDMDDRRQSAQVLTSGDTRIWLELKESGNMNAIDKFKEEIAVRYFKPALDEGQGMSRGFRR